MLKKEPNIYDRIVMTTTRLIRTLDMPLPIEIRRKHSFLLTIPLPYHTIYFTHSLLLGD